MSELLNCPFCGKQPTALDFLPSCKIVCCDNKVCPGAPAMLEDSKDAAAEKWNNQTEVLRLQAEIARLQKGLLALSRAYSDWPMNVSDEDEREIIMLVHKAESDKQQTS